MKKIIFSLSLILGIQFIACSQSNYSRWNGKTWEQLSGSGKLVKLNPSVAAFSNIEVSNMNVKVKVETGAEEYSLHVSIDDNLKDFFRFNQDGKTIKLSMDYSGGKYPRWLSSSNTVVTIKAPSVENLTNNGNSQLEMNLENQSSFNLVTEGNPNIILTGKIAILNLQSSGNAAIKAGNLLTEKIILSADGNSDIEVNTKELIEKSVKGNNDISNFFYKTKKEVVSEDENTVSKKEFIHFKLKNNSLLPVKVIVISYRPDEKGNGTTAYWLLPYASKSYSFPAETSVYLANQNQVDAVMSGAKINDQTPFLVVKKEDEGKSFDIK